MHSGAIGVVANQAQGSVPRSLATLNGVAEHYSDSSLSVRATAGGNELSYIALVAGFQDAANCLFVKIQDGDADGMFDRVFFYYGNNGMSWGASAHAHDLAIPTASASLELSFDQLGDRAVLRVENDASGSTEVFYGDQLLAAANGLGVEFGLGTYGSALADDFLVNDGGAQMQLSATGSPGGVMTFEVSRTTPGTTIALIYSFRLGAFTIPNQFPCSGTELGLGDPVGWVFSNSSAGGEASYSQFVPGSAAGMAHVQALDIATCGLSNVLSL